MTLHNHLRSLKQLVMRSASVRVKDVHLSPRRFRFQFRAIFSIIQQYGWSYVSVIYLEGSYGENGFKQLRDLFDASDICLAAVHKVPTRLTAEEVYTH